MNRQRGQSRVAALQSRAWARSRKQRHRDRWRVVANNASGMTAGTKLNSYHTVVAMKVLLPSGTIVDTADSEAIVARPFGI